MAAGEKSGAGKVSSKVDPWYIALSRGGNVRRVLNRAEENRVGPKSLWLLLSLALWGCTQNPFGCGSPAAPQYQVRWPASSRAVSLEQQLVATSRRDDARSRGEEWPSISMLPRAVPPTPELPDEAPGLRAQAHQVAGLWVAEIEIGEVEEGTALPLVMMLHGRGDSPRLPGGPFGRVPTPMRVLIPRGPLVLGQGFAWAKLSVTSGRFDELANDLLVQARRLARVLDHFRALRPTAGSPIVTGFSQGGMLAWVLAMRYPNSVGLALPLSAWVPPAARNDPLTAVPTRALHGKSDPIVPVGPTRSLVQLLQQAGNEVEWLEYDGVGHEMTAAMNAQFEEWLEAALEERAPGLSGGLGQRGEDPEPMELSEPALEVDLAQEAVEPDGEHDGDGGESAAEDGGEALPSEAGAPHSQGGGV